LIVYKATNKINGKSYIGQTTQKLRVRRNCHKTQAFSNKIKDTYFYRAIKKYGFNNFKWEIIEHCDSKEEMDEMEFHYIKQYNSFGDGGYNLTFGGEGGMVGIKRAPFSKEARKKMSEAKQGKWSGEDNPKYNKGYLMVGENNPMYGKKHTKETINKLRKASSGKNNYWYGKKFSEEYKFKLAEGRSRYWLVIFPDGKKKVIKNLKQFCGDNNLHDGAMVNVSKGNRNHHKNFKCKRLYDIEIRRIKCLESEK